METIEYGQDLEVLCEHCGGGMVSVGSVDEECPYGCTDEDS